MAMVVDDTTFNKLHRILNTNIHGTVKVVFALTAIRGIGRRFSYVICKKAGIDMKKRAGELSPEEIERLQAIISNPSQFSVPNYMLNRRKDVIDGKNTQEVANKLDSKMREDLERMKKMRLHRGLRHHWGLRVRGQHTKTTGRRGRTVGVSKKK
eukprot:TRINITY_DN41926_c0_g1_i1.p1 TRINITY_DN41926_c0_g1~~TRINITY_DN41926_c0_g1_i1.p1  ORF type:complete len:163 (-),score=58.22 TRINITY_DN41926_c0_g1_i1:177-638(-)